MLKGQPLTFLHVFHHAVVLLMAYGVRAWPAPELAVTRGAVARVCAVAAGHRPAGQHGHSRGHVRPPPRLQAAALSPQAQVFVLFALLAGPQAGKRSEDAGDERPDCAIPLQARPAPQPCAAPPSSPPPAFSVPFPFSSSTSRTAAAPASKPGASTSPSTSSWCCSLRVSTGRRMRARDAQKLREWETTRVSNSPSLPA